MTQTNAASKRQVKAAKERAARDAEVEETIIKVIMRHPDGRRWMWNQLAECQCFANDANLDPGWMAYQKGLRNYGLKLFAAVGKHAPAEYLTMTKEQSFVVAKELNDGGSANDSDDDDSDAA